MTFAILSLSGKEALAGGFTSSCFNIVLDSKIPGFGLRATCRRADGTCRSAAVSLDNNIGNIDGVLRANSSDFSDSCRVIGGLTGGGPGRGIFLTADCLARDGVFTRTSIDLNRYISNVNGSLRFD